MNLVVNKTVHHNYEILEQFEAGMKLLGSEVKSLRQKNGSLREAYVKVKEGRLVLTNAYVPPFQNHADLYDPYRERLLLLHKKEVMKIRHLLKQGGVTIVPVRIYATKRFIKIEIAIARGKKKHDKRNELKKRAITRDIERELK